MTRSWGSHLHQDLIPDLSFISRENKLAAESSPRVAAQPTASRAPITSKTPHPRQSLTPAPTAGSTTSKRRSSPTFRSTEGVELVLEWAARCTGTLAAIGPTVGGYAYPAPAAYATEAIAVRSHHDYAAEDIAMPVGTPFFSMVDGTVATASSDAGIYPTYGQAACP